MTPTPFNPLDDRISAYLDDELTRTERAAFEAECAGDPAASQLLATLHRQRSLLQELRPEPAPAGFIDDVLAEVERDALIGARRPKPARRGLPRALAAGLLLALAVAGGYGILRTVGGPHVELALHDDVAQFGGATAEPEDAAAVPSLENRVAIVTDSPVVGRAGRTIASAAAPPGTVQPEKDADEDGLAGLGLADARRADLEQMMMKTEATARDDQLEPAAPAPAEPARALTAAQGDGVVEIIVVCLDSGEQASIAQQARRLLERTPGTCWDAADLERGPLSLRSAGAPGSGTPSSRRLFVTTPPDELPRLLDGLTAAEVDGVYFSHGATAVTGYERAFVRAEQSARRSAELHRKQVAAAADEARSAGPAWPAYQVWERFYNTLLESDRVVDRGAPIEDPRDPPDMLGAMVDRTAPSTSAPPVERQLLVILDLVTLNHATPSSAPHAPEPSPAAPHR